LVGHTQNYSKVTIPFEEGIIGTQVIMKIVETYKWHCVGEIIDRNPPPKEIDPNYFAKVRKMY